MHGSVCMVMSMAWSWRYMLKPLSWLQERVLCRYATMTVLIIIVMATRTIYNKHACVTYTCIYIINIYNMHVVIVMVIAEINELQYQ